jgi:tryptophanyl-tRNA synthetase
VRIFAIF